MSENPVKVALLSYGMSGEVFHGPLLNVLPQFQLTTIVQRSSDKAASHFPGVAIARSVDDVFRDPAIELVVVNTPNETHFEFASKAMQAGKHVVVEKPFTVSVKEGEELIKISEKTNRVLTVFQNRRWDGDFLTVKKVLSSGRLGKIVEVEAHYDRFRNYVEPNTWKEESRPGTGILYNLGSHMLDQMVVLFGLPDYLDARLGIQRPGGKVDDFYDIRMEYEERLVILKSSYLVKEPMPRYILHGVNGSFVKYGIDPQEQALKDKIRPDIREWGTESRTQWGKLNLLENDQHVEERVSSEPGDYKLFYENVFDSIRKASVPDVKPREALAVIRLIEACYESNKNKRAVRIDFK